MATLVQTLEQFKKHVTINYDFKFDVMLPYITKMERKYIKPAIGDGMYEDYTETEPTDPNPVAVMDLLRDASSNLAMLEYSKVGIIQISDSGFHISANSNSTPAEWWQIRDLRRLLLDTGLAALDEALRIMESNEGDFTDWTDSDEYQNYKSLFCKKTSDFQQYFNINSSALTFRTVRPHLMKVEDKYFEGMLGKDTMDQIKAATEEPALKALAICKAAQVSLTISEISFEGMFLFKPGGLYNFVDEIPGEKHDRLTPQELDHLSKVKREEGIQYLKKLKQHLSDNSDTFVDYATYEAVTKEDIAYNTGSMLSL